MKTITELFKTGGFSEQENIIKNVPVNNKQHRYLLSNYCRELEPKFKWTDEVRSKYSDLFYYFTGSEDSKFDLNKGLYLVGDTGSGKSLIFSVFKDYTGQINKCNSFKVFDFESLVSVAKDKGSSALIDQFWYSETNPFTKYIDDFGNVRADVNNYQNYMNVCEEIITESYRVYQKFRKLTHYSSNKMPDELGIDQRCIGRIIETCNIVSLSESDFRIENMR